MTSELDDEIITLTLTAYEIRVLLNGINRRMDILSASNDYPEKENDSRLLKKLSEAYWILFSRYCRRLHHRELLNVQK